MTKDSVKNFSPQLPIFFQAWCQSNLEDSTSQPAQFALNDAKNLLLGPETRKNMVVRGDFS